MNQRALVLFDIDGTLIRRAGPHHRQALAYGIQRVTGIETSTDGIPLQGMLDPDILTIMMRRAGAKLALIRQAMPRIIQAAEGHYRRICPILSGKHCPGVQPLLEELIGRGTVLGLVTGNLTRIAWRKLERAGLRDYFQIGAFGEAAKTRAGLARLAIREARRRKWIARDALISLVGDAPADIIAAKANRIRSIAVKTGISSPAELEAESPDFLFEDLEDPRLREPGMLSPAE